MPENDFLDSITEAARPEPNVGGDFDCITCRKRTADAHYDYERQILSWYCPDGHRSEIKEFKL